jgi:hypothetical protein
MEKDAKNNQSLRTTKRMKEQQKRKAAEPQNHKAIKFQRSMHQRPRRIWLGGMCGALK